MCALKFSRFGTDWTKYDGPIGLRAYVLDEYPLIVLSQIPKMMSRDKYNKIVLVILGLSLLWQVQARSRAGLKRAGWRRPYGAQEASGREGTQACRVCYETGSGGQSFSWKTWRARARSKLAPEDSASGQLGRELWYASHRDHALQVVGHHCQPDFRPRAAQPAQQKSRVPKNRIFQSSERMFGQRSSQTHRFGRGPLCQPT